MKIYHQLTHEQRYQIYALWRTKHSLAQSGQNKSSRIFEQIHDSEPLYISYSVGDVHARLPCIEKQGSRLFNTNGQLAFELAVKHNSIAVFRTWLHDWG